MVSRVVPAALAFTVAAGLLHAADPALLNLLMPDAKVVAGINVEQAAGSTFGQFLLAQLPANEPGLSKLMTATGFDPRRDLREILTATDAQPGPHGLTAARGTFDTARIFAAAQAAGKTVETYNGVQILTGEKTAHPHGLAFLGSSIAVAGDIDSVHGAIDRRSATGTAILASLASQVQQLSGTFDAWSISILPLSAFSGQIGAAGATGNLGGILNSDLLKTIQQTSGGVRFGDMVQVSGQALSNSAQNATALADVLRFVANMVRVNAPASSAAAIGVLLQNLIVQADGSVVNVTLSIPEPQLESLIRTAEQNKDAQHKL
jgi:hypothetical protein